MAASSWRPVGSSNEWGFVMGILLDALVAGLRGRFGNPYFPLVLVLLAGRIGGVSARYCSPDSTNFSALGGQSRHGFGRLRIKTRRFPWVWRRVAKRLTAQPCTHKLGCLGGP